MVYAMSPSGRVARRKRSGAPPCRTGSSEEQTAKRRSPRGQWIAAPARDKWALRLAASQVPYILRPLRSLELSDLTFTGSSSHHSIFGDETPIMTCSETIPTPRFKLDSFMIACSSNANPIMGSYCDFLALRTCTLRRAISTSPKLASSSGSVRISV